VIKARFLTRFEAATDIMRVTRRCQTDSLIIHNYWPDFGLVTPGVCHFALSFPDRKLNVTRTADRAEGSEPLMNAHER
jgi:hypothetical protein